MEKHTKETDSGKSKGDGESFYFHFRHKFINNKIENHCSNKYIHQENKKWMKTYNPMDIETVKIDLYNDEIGCLI